MASCPDCNLPARHVGACAEPTSAFICDQVVIDLTPEVLAMACEGCGEVGTLLVVKTPKEASATCSRCGRILRLDAKSDDSGGLPGTDPAADQPRPDRGD